MLPLLLLQLVPHPPPGKDVEDERLYQFYAIVCGGIVVVVVVGLFDPLCVTFLLIAQTTIH